MDFPSREQEPDSAPITPAGALEYCAARSCLRGHSSNQECFYLPEFICNIFPVFFFFFVRYKSINYVNRNNPGVISALSELVVLLRNKLPKTTQICSLSSMNPNSLQKVKAKQLLLLPTSTYCFIHSNFATSSLLSTVRPYRSKVEK